MGEGVFKYVTGYRKYMVEYPSRFAQRQLCRITVFILQEEICYAALNHQYRWLWLLLLVESEKKEISWDLRTTQLTST